MLKTEVYGRIEIDLPAAAEAARFTAPGGKVQDAMIYTTRDAAFHYDRHGYETVELSGPPQGQAAYTACSPGRHVLEVFTGGSWIKIEEIEAIEAGNSGFVEVSPRDPRYFALSVGDSYVPIGLNLVGCDYDRLPAGLDHFAASEEIATTGMIQWRRWFHAMQAAGVNYCRVWLSNRYTEARTELMGVHDETALARFDALVKLARASGVRLKLCMEHWRTFSDEGHFAYRRYVDPDTGRQLTDEEEWFQSPKWNARWLEDICPYLARCQNDPVVFAWELWNENDCGEASFEAVEGFTRRMLAEVKKLSPRNLAVNSLGSFDEEWKQQRQDAFRDMPEMDFQQVHRYLDQGAPMEICHTDPVAFSIEAVDRSRRQDKPVILTETGAVNDRHVGPFRFYHCDHDGLIFHDVTYPAFFAGAAGSGHIWHWESYVEPLNLWRHFRPLVGALDGIQADRENFVSGVIPNKEAWILTLTGKDHALIFVRNKADRWDRVLRDETSPAPVSGLYIPADGALENTFWLMDGAPGDPVVENGGIRLPNFVHGCILRLKTEMP